MVVGPAATSHWVLWREIHRPAFVGANGNLFPLTMSDDLVSTFLAVAGTDDAAVAKQYLDLTNNDLEYAVTLYMESHPPSIANATSNQESDEQIAQRLQQEAYGTNGDDVREADANVHRHETLVDSFDGFMPPPMSRPTDIFGSGRIGVFNQRFEDEADEYLDRDDAMSEDEDWEDDDDDRIIVVDSDDDDDEQNTRPVSRRRRRRSDRLTELTSTQRRLATLFRPPFDLMSRVDLDSAKKQGRTEKKWILINIQDPAEFTCQVLNRDFWSNQRIKTVVKEHFIFLQYQKDSPNGQNYQSFYTVSELPHISILDPLTGERVRTWPDGQVPKVDDWIDEVDDFLAKFSLDQNSKNPTVQHEVKFDPDALSEEQQIEFALKQSMQENQGSSKDNAIDLDELEQIESVQDSVQDPFLQIQPQDHEEPLENFTRIQIRFPNGKRLVHKFGKEELVSTIYLYLKHILQSEGEVYGLAPGETFRLSNLSNRSKSLIDYADDTVVGAGLLNASILLEKD